MRTNPIRREKIPVGNLSKFIRKISESMGAFQNGDPYKILEICVCVTLHRNGNTDVEIDENVP